MLPFVYSSHRRKVLFSAIFCFCFILFCELGDAPVAPDATNTKTDIDTLKEKIMVTLSAAPSNIRQGFDTIVSITAFVYNKEHNPIIGQIVNFTASDGIISSKDTTDSKGTATASFISSKSDRPVIITARILRNDSIISATTLIDIIKTIPAIDSVNGNMRIFAQPSNLVAASNIQSKVSVTVFDVNRNPLIGKEIAFSTTRGIVTATSRTDSTGTATALFYAEPFNGNAIVTASMKHNDSSVSVATTLTLSGVEVIITPQLSSAPPGSSIPVVIKLIDGKGDPIADRPVNFTCNGDSVKITNGSGVIITTALRQTPGYVSLRATSLGATDSTSIYFGSTIPVDSNKQIRSLRLFASTSQLRADNSAEARITAVIISKDNHNPLVGDTVEFASSLGIIDRFGITDTSGRTVVTLRSAPVNGTCVVRAVLKGNSTIKDSTSVLFSGITLTLSVDRDNIHINDTSLVTALLKDGSGNPLGSDIVNFTVTEPGRFTNNTRLVQSALSPSGNTVIKVSSPTAGKVIVYAVSANVYDSIPITFTTNNISVVSAKKSLSIGGLDSTLITATFVNQNNVPIKDSTITFATNAGTITSKTAITDATGKASTYLKSGFFSATATIQAKSSNGSAYTTVQFKAGTPASIALSITPDNVGINGGNAELIAYVRDDNGNVVSNAEVSFSITKGPGGGEYIDKPIIATTVDGIARSRIYAGSLPSEYRGCEVKATVLNYTTTANLTISGEPYTVTISRPQDDTVAVQNAGILDESTFEFNIGAVVKDVNGNPVADGTPVNFSAFVSGMYLGYLKFLRWELSGADIKPIVYTDYMDIPFEDINNNLKFDKGIDLEIDNNNLIAQRGDDVNGDGIMDYNGTHDFFWPFSGAEPFWPASKVYTYNQKNIALIPDTITETVIDTLITPVVSLDSNTLTFDTNYVIRIDTIINLKSLPIDSTYTIYADLNKNGKWDQSPITIDHDGDGIYDGPPSGDFEYWRWEMRPQFKDIRFNFSSNDFAVVIDRSAVTKNGVAYTKLTYPRQFARRLLATVNAETKGIRDKDGERFVLPVIVQ